MAIQLPFDILDYIFLVLDRKTLISCSKDSVLSPIVERHVYYHIIVQIGSLRTTTVSDDALAFGPGHLSKLISDNPHILCYVRILQIEILGERPSDSFANTLLAFPALECIMLNIRDCILPVAVRAALEDRLRLQTVEEVHLKGNGIPLSLLEHSKYIKSLLLSAFYPEAISYPLNLTHPQPHSLRLLNNFISTSLRSWAKLHSRELRSFRTKLFGWEDSSEILGACSGTLVKLDIDVAYFRDDFLKISPVLPNLEQLTIRTKENSAAHNYVSRPQVIAKLVHLFLSSVRHLSIDINIIRDLGFTTPVDFSPFAFLGTISRSIPRIDLYVHAERSQAIDHAQVLSSLEVYEDIARSIKEGVFVIHSGKTAPDLV